MSTGIVGLATLKLRYFGRAPTTPKIPEEADENCADSCWGPSPTPSATDDHPGLHLSAKFWSLMLACLPVAGWDSFWKVTFYEGADLCQELHKALYMWYFI